MTVFAALVACSSDGANERSLPGGSSGPGKPADGPFVAAPGSGGSGNFDVGSGGSAGGGGAKTDESCASSQCCNDEDQCIAGYCGKVIVR